MEKIASSVLDIYHEDTPDKKLVLRICGTNQVILEYDPVRLDLMNRIHLLQLEQYLQEHKPEGLLEITGGLSSLLISYSYKKLSLKQLIDFLRIAEDETLKNKDEVIPSRIVHLPITFQDTATKAAIKRYSESIRSEAPYLPDNLEFLARSNDMDVDTVKKTILSTDYIVFGLGDVYMGAPCAVPLDSRCKLNAPKYNPPRIYTPEGAVGIGGIFMSIYSSESPGGYQLVGRTVPIWNKEQRGNGFAESPWLLRPFDRIRYYSVPEEELDQIRMQIKMGTFDFDIEKGFLNRSNFI